MTIGFQLGGQAFSDMIFFEYKHAYEEFISGEFKFDAVASTVAITAGVQAKAGTGGELMYEAAIDSQKFSFNPW